MENEIDPVSGNEVPVGAMPQEVRDNVDAKLSEGEYVVPADVVRYFGVRFFEELGQKAKGELQDMHSEGRMGNEPMDDDMPFSAEELSVIDVEDDVPGFAEGGVVTQMEVPDFLQGTSAGGNEEYRTYRNAEGMTLTIRFVNGQPVSPIPPGYTPYDAAADTPATEQAVTVTESRSDGPETQIGRTARNEVEDAAKGLSELSGEQLGDLTGFLTGKGGNIAMGLASATPFAGLVGIGSRAINSAVAREAQTRFQNATTEAEKQQYFDIFDQATTRGKDVGDGIFGGGGVMGGGGTLNDNDGDGKRDLGDTWFGDLLGLDGKAGVQGAGLGDSFNGARRTGGTGKQAKSLDDSRDASSGSANDESTGGGFWQGVKDFFSGNKDDEDK